MITREQESKVREVFRDAIDNAANEIAEKGIIELWWGDGFAERMAEILTQSVALMAESCEMAEDGN